MPRRPLDRAYDDALTRHARDPESQASADSRSTEPRVVYRYSRVSWVVPRGTSLVWNFRPSVTDATMSIPRSRALGLSADGRREPFLNPRRVGLAVLVTFVGAFLAYMVVAVPVVAPHLRPSDRLRHWPIAVLGAVAVILIDAVVLVAIARRGQRLRINSASTSRPKSSAVAESAVEAAPRSQRVPRRVVAITAAASAVLVGAALANGYPLWVLGLAALIPWLPFFTVQTVRTTHLYGFYAFFVAVVGFQTLHMGEHTVQVLQLAITQGDLAQSHGVFGQLDFELVHFVSDIGVWLAVAVLVWVYGIRNRWLMIAFVAASAHAIEHLYLWSIYIGHRGFYTQGGFAGIMGNSGLIGSPLARPYMHFAYNFVVLVPLMLALWDQMPHIRPSPARTRRGERRVSKGRDVPDVSELAVESGLFENYVTDTKYLASVQSDPSVGWTRL
jgi:hypothetical protein